MPITITIPEPLATRLQIAARAHNLIALILLILPIEPNWRPLQPLARTLNVYAVDYRYPGNSATKLNAKEAIAHCREIRKVVRLSFGLTI